MWSRPAGAPQALSWAARPQGGKGAPPCAPPETQLRELENEFFRKLSHECENKFMGFRERPHEECQACFQNSCPDGPWEMALAARGTNPSLQGFLASWQGEHERHLAGRMWQGGWEGSHDSGLSLVIWKGRTDLQRLDGTVCLGSDEPRAYVSITGF